MRAVRVPGWKHLVDLLLKRCLQGLTFFPKFIDELRAVVKFFRSQSTLDVFVADLAKRGLGAASSMLAGLKHLPGFAEWRWNTLSEICSQLGKVVDTLMSVFDAQCFKQLRDQTTFKKVASCLGSRRWRTCFRFVATVAEELGALLSWGAGCDCHEEDLTAGTSVHCMAKGRRIKTAYAHVRQVLSELCSQADGWTPAFFEGDAALWQEAQGAVRGLRELGMRKFEFFNRCPYLLARLDEEGIKEQALAEWASRPPEQHHRVTREFLDPGHNSGLRRLVDTEIAPNGEISSEKLAAEVRSLQELPMDDAVCESPHAAASRLKKSSRRADFAWIASSMRLQHNLDYVAPHLCEEHPGAINLQREWTNYKSILQVKKSRWNRPVKLKGSVVHSCVYRLNNNPYFEGGPEVIERAAEAAAGDGGDGGDGDGHDGDAPPPPAIHERHAASEDVKMLREYLLHALPRFCYFSVPCVGVEAADDEEEFKFFQLLDYKRRDVMVNVGEEAASLLFGLSVQPLEQWMGVGVTASHREVFIVQDPCVVDIIEIMGQSLEQRKKVQIWTPDHLSEVQGCVSLINPVVARPTMTLRSSSLPTLALLDELESQGFVGREARVDHRPGGDKEFDTRAVSRKSWYLRCLLGLEHIWAAGWFSFPSGLTQAFYQLLLRDPSKCALGMTAAACNAILKEKDNDHEPLPLEDRVAKFAPPMPAPAADGDIAGDDGLAGDDGPGGAADGDIAGHEQDQPEPDDTGDTNTSPPAPDETSGSSSSSSSSSSGSSDSSSSDESAGVGQLLGGGDGIAGDAANLYAAPNFIAGQPVVEELRVGAYHRLRVRCSAHERCGKSRNVNLLPELGPRAAEAYLACWLAASHLPADRHRKFIPRITSMREYLESA